MTDQDQKQLGNTLWGIADQLRGAMNADDFRDYMLSFLFLRYLSDNYAQAAQKELGADYPELGLWIAAHLWRCGIPRIPTTSKSSRSRCAGRSTMWFAPNSSGEHIGIGPHPEPGIAAHPAKGF